MRLSTMFKVTSFLNIIGVYGAYQTGDLLQAVVVLGHVILLGAWSIYERREEDYESFSRR